MGLQKGLPGAPPRNPPGSPPRPRGAPGNFPGNFPAPGARPGARRAPRAPPGSPPGHPPGGPFWDLSGAFILTNSLLLAHFGGARQGCILAPPGGCPGPPPGRAKSAHFFGYLITLPVGTVWATFSPPRPGPPPPGHPPLWRPSPGIWPGCEIGSVIMSSLGDMDPIPGVASTSWMVGLVREGG